MCHRIGMPPMSTIGLGRTVVSSLSRVPRPPARITAFTDERTSSRFGGTNEGVRMKPPLRKSRPHQGVPCVAYHGVRSTGIDHGVLQVRSFRKQDVLNMAAGTLPCDIST